MWGGKTVFGIDCSGLIQVTLNYVGVNFPRNSNEQFKFLKNQTTNQIKRGSLVFWNGHVAIGLDKENILHSNAHHLSVQIENFLDAKTRIDKNYGLFKGIKNIQS